MTTTSRLTDREARQIARKKERRERPARECGLAEVAARREAEALEALLAKHDRRRKARKEKPL